MKSQLQSLKGLSRRIDVEVPIEEVNATLEKLYKEIQKKAKFKGFRPGKAPMNMIKSEYKHRVEYDMTDQVIRRNYDKAIDEHGLDPVAFPQINFEGYKENEPLKFSATFEVRPEIVLKKYKGLEVEKEKLEIKEDVVDKILEDIRASKSTLAPIAEDRAAQSGDVAIIDFSGTLDGKPLQGGSATEHPLELGSGSFIPGFEEGIVGMTPGNTKTLNLKFPDNYQAAEISGKEVEFSVTLKEIKKKILPELNDDLAKTLGNHQTLQELREDIKKDVLAGEEKRVQDDLKTRMLQVLVENNSFEVPQVMVAEQKKIIIEDIHQKMKQDGMDENQFEEYKSKWDADFTKSAEFVIRSSMLINKIAREEGLAATEEDLENRLRKQAEQSGIEIEKIRSFYSKEDHRSRLQFRITEEKVMELLISQGKIKEVPKDKLKPLQ